MTKALLLLAVCVLFSVLASLALKQGAHALKDGFSAGDLFASPMLWLGGLFYAAAFLGYIYTLRVVPLSLAQPVITAGVSVFTALLAVQLFRESLSLFNWAGLLLVCLGVFLLFVGRY